MFLRDFLRYDYCPEGAGDEATHARAGRTHRLVADKLVCAGPRCRDCGCPGDQHRALEQDGREPFPYCLTYGCGCESRSPAPG